MICARRTLTPARSFKSRNVHVSGMLQIMRQRTTLPLLQEPKKQRKEATVSMRCNVYYNVNPRPARARIQPRFFRAIPAPFIKIHSDNFTVLSAFFSLLLRKYPANSSAGRSLSRFLTQHGLIRSERDQLRRAR